MLQRPPECKGENQLLEYWMGEALKEAALAAEKGEVPVGAIVVRDHELSAAGVLVHIASLEL